MQCKVRSHILLVCRIISDDNILAHRNLYEVAGILHRDIKPDNILINPRGVEGDRGVLIDFDHAIRTDDESPYSSKRKIVRTIIFRLTSHRPFPLKGHISLYVEKRTGRQGSAYLSGRFGVVLLRHRLHRSDLFRTEISQRRTHSPSRYLAATVGLRRQRWLFLP